MHLISFLMLAAVTCFMTAPVAAFNHIVGGSFGWSTPGNLSFYEDWAKPRTFGVGDKLVFPFRTGVHSVVQVSEEEFQNCTQNDAIDMHYSGPLIIELPKTGTFYYYCGVGTHCEAGQKLKVTVVNAEGSAGTPITPNASVSAPADHKSSAKEGCDVGMVSGMLVLLLSVFI
ncbi:hypothetical protein PVL29_001604 [Vitis rotundifolia]|uniref:Phytocyanin domain-containing protein n=1 Tax=Vitis rotundifolia TaxID=103349 RepID=A0AA39AGR4_VITRO|nr:hypothetical protein PVL29_001604 [Vitis rotundifolia]